MSYSNLRSSDHGSLFKPSRCLNCEDVYIGETGRKFDIRLKEHMKDLGSNKPEDHWSCKRSPDILTLVKHKTYKTWKIYGKEMTLAFNTHITSLSQLVVCIYQLSGHRLQ